MSTSENHPIKEKKNIFKLLSLKKLNSITNWIIAFIATSTVLITQIDLIKNKLDEWFTKSEESFSANPNTYKVLIVPSELDYNEKLNYQLERLLARNLNDMRYTENLPIEIIFNQSHKITSTDIYSEAQEKGKETRADMVIIVEKIPRNTDEQQEVILRYILTSELTPNIKMWDKTELIRINDLSEITEGILQNKTDYVLYFASGIKKIEEQNCDAAKKYFDFLFENYPDRIVDVYIKLGNCFFAIEKSLAASYYKKSIEIDSNSAEAHNNLALCLDMQNSLVAAEGHYQKALKENPEYVIALNNYGVLLIKQNRTEEAKKMLKKALNIEESYAEAAFNYANILKEEGKMDEAFFYYKKGENLPESKLALASILEQKGDHIKARLLKRVAKKILIKEGRTANQINLFAQMIDDLGKHEMVLEKESVDDSLQINNSTDLDSLTESVLISEKESVVGDSLQINNSTDLDSLAESVLISEKESNDTIESKILKKNELLTIKGNIVYSVSFSPNSKTLLTGSSSGTTKLWDLQGNELQNFKGQKGTINSVIFSPDGKRLLTISSDGTTNLWDLQGNVLHTFKVPSGYIHPVNFSPDGNKIIISSSDGDGKVKLLDLKSNRYRTLKGHLGYVNSTAFSYNSQRVLTGSKDKTAILWDLKGNLIKKLKGNTNTVTSVAFSPNGRYMLTGNYDKVAILWDYKGRQIQQFKGHSSYISFVTFSPNNQFILTKSQDINILWDLEGKQIQKLEGSSIAFSPDGKFILTVNEKTATLWDLKGNKVQQFTGHTSSINAVAFSPNGKYILTGSYDGTAKLWDILVK